MPAIIRDADEASFATEVLERSAEVPVVVDFWAAWCGPCRTLGPILEEAVTARGGEVELVKIDVDSNQGLALQFQVQGIPAVKVFRDGRVVQQFEGARPRAFVDQVLDAVVPSPADRLVRRAATEDDDDATATLHEALTVDPVHPGASMALARRLMDDDPDEARRLATRALPDPEAANLLTELDVATTAGDPVELQARLEGDPDDTEARAALARLRVAAGANEAAIDLLLDGVRRGGDAREPAREQLVQLFALLGDDPVVTASRPRLASALW